MTNEYLDIIDDKKDAGDFSDSEVNPYSKMLDEEDQATRIRLSASATVAASSNPEEVARKKRVANILKVPLSVVEGNPDAAKQQSLIQTIDDDTKDAPALREKYTDADFAKLAHDQSKSMGNIERIARDAFAGFGGDFAGSGIHGLGVALHALERLTGSKSIMADTLEDVGGKVKDYWQGLAPTDQTFFDQVVRGVAQMGGQLPTFALAAPVGLAMMLGQGADQMYDKIAMDKAAQQAEQKAKDWEVLSGGLITAVTEGVASKLLVHPSQILAFKNMMLNRAANIALGGVEEGLQEFMENIGQDLAHVAATSPESRIAFDDALEAGGVGAIVGVVAEGVIQGALHMRVRGLQKALANLSDATKAQQLRERDPESYQGFADVLAQHLATTSDGVVDDLYVDANVFNQLLKDQKLNPAEVTEAIPSLEEQIGEGRVTGGDVVIPLNDYLGKLAGTDLGDALAAHLRAAPDSPSITDIQEAVKDKENLMKRADEILAQQEKNKEFTAEANEIQKTIYDQTVATGVYTPAVSKAYSDFIKSFYVTLANDFGTTPKKMYELAPYKIALRTDEGEAPAYGQTIGEMKLPKLNKKEESVVTAAREAYANDKTVGARPDWKNQKVVVTHWSKSPTLTETDPKFHGTNHRGEELGRSVGGKGSTPFYIPMTFFGFAKYKKEPVVGPHRYGTVIDGNTIYDGEKDPLDLYPSNDYMLNTYGKVGQIVCGEMFNYRVAHAGFKGIVYKGSNALYTFAPTKVVPVSAGNASLAANTRLEGDFSQVSLDTVDKIFNVVKDNPDGFTIKIPEGKLQTSGFAVAPSKVTETRLDVLTRENLGAYLRRFQDVFATDKRAFLGGWYDSQTGKFVLDISYVVDSEEEALYLAENGNQDAIFNIDKLEEIRTAEGIQKLKDSGKYSEEKKAALQDVPAKLEVALNQNMLDQSAWHGSPFTFNKFSTKNIGSGEGSQAFGYGLYFSGVREIAEYYRNVVYDTKYLKETNKRLSQLARQIEPYRVFGEANKFKDSKGAELKAEYDRLLEEKLNKQGRLYKVELAPKEDEYLLWDKPFAEQSPKVKKAIEKDFTKALMSSIVYSNENGKIRAEVETTKKHQAVAYGNTKEEATAKFDKLLDYMSGSAIYSSLSDKLGGDKAASKFLLSVGVRGVKYLTGVNRAAGSGSFNYVIFSEDDVAIEEMYQKMAGQKRGGFNPSTLTNLLTKQADYSTFLHESAHMFLTTYAQLAELPNAPDRIKNDMQTLLKWFGVADLATWNAMTTEEQRKHHETFAYNFESYILEGKAPSIQMQSMFERFSAWLKKIYISIRDDLNTIYRQEHGEDLPILTGEVRQVMDRMLASDKQIEQAEKVRGMAPLFSTQQEANMNDEEWAAYQDLQREAHEEALSKHRAASLRQMKWLSNAKSKALKILQSAAKDTRKTILQEVTDEINNIPLYRAQEALKGATEVEALAISDALGYDSVAALKEAINNMPRKSDAIRENTDKRMMEEYGELVDPAALERAVNEAVHNQARAKFIGVELRHLAKSQRPVRVMQEAARQAARTILGTKSVKSIRPREYLSAEAKAAMMAEKRMKEGDAAATVQAKEFQLLQNQLASEALKANAFVEKAYANFKKLFNSDKRLGKSRDMNYVNTARAILAHYGFGTSEEPASAYLNKIKAYDPEFYAEIEPMITAHQLQAKPINDLSLNDFTDLADQIQALWHLSRRNKQIEIDGLLMERKEVVSLLNEEIKDLTTGSRRPGYNKAMTKWEKAKINLMGARAALRRVEAWVDAMDKGNPNGLFRKYIWVPIIDAVTKYRTAKKEYLQKYIALLKEVEPLLKGKDIVATEIGYTFKPQELLHAILHTGNESNKRKLLLGREWASLTDRGTLDSTKWDAFILRAQKEGLLTKDYYDFAQKVWDLLEQMKPMAQKAHREMYGFYFNEITATPFDTLFGAYAGGYVPALVDSDMVTEGAMRNEKETSLVDNSFMFPTTGRGFTRSRVEYNRPLLLNLGSLASHMDKVLRFSFIEPHIKDVARIVKTNKSFASALDVLDPTIRGDMLVPWLQRTAMQMVSIPAKGKAGQLADSVFRYLRRATGVQMMVANVTNTLQQFTGLSISALKVRPALLGGALIQYVRQPGETMRMINEKSAYMQTRMNADQYELQQAMDELLLNPDKYDRLKEFVDKHGYFMQQATQGVVDTITWIGAYNQAAEANVTEKEAVHRADAAVRMTQGSFAPEDVSRIETGSHFMRAFTQFYSYFNMQANILGTEFMNVARSLGVKKGAGRLLYIYTFGFMIPAVLAEVIVQAMGGFDAGDDDEYDIADFLKLFLTAQARPLAAMTPGVGQLATALINRTNNNYYDDRMSTSPAVSMIESAVNAPFSVYKAIAEDGSYKRASKDLLSLLGAASGLPLVQLGKPVGYALDVAQGRVEPTNNLDYARGLISGKDVNRQQ